MTAIVTILATAAIAFAGHLVYGAILTGREYDRSERAWADAQDRIIPARPTRLRPVAPTRRLQRA